MTLARGILVVLKLISSENSIQYIEKNIEKRDERKACDYLYEYLHSMNLLLKRLTIRQSESSNSSRVNLENTLTAQWRFVHYFLSSVSSSAGRSALASCALCVAAIAASSAATVIGRGAFGDCRASPPAGATLCEYTSILKCILDIWRINECSQ